MNRPDHFINASFIFLSNSAAITIVAGQAYSGGCRSRTGAYLILMHNLKPKLALRLSVPPLRLYYLQWYLGDGIFSAAPRSLAQLGFYVYITVFAP